MNDLEKRLTKLQKQFDNLRIIGGEGVSVSGGMGFGGYTVETKKGISDSGTGTGTMTPISGCTDPGAINFNPFATVDDGSCEYGTGACCVDADCSITSEADCDGVYQGDDTVCDPNPCICPEVTLDCDQVCATASKCGFEGANNSGASTDTYWRTLRVYVENTCYPPATGSMTSDETVEITAPFEDPCSCNSTEVACSGSGTCSCDDGTSSCDWCASFCVPDDCGGSVALNTAPFTRSGSIISDTEYAFFGYDSGGGRTAFGGTILGTEVTTVDLLTYLSSILTSYDDDFNDTCEAKKIDVTGDNSKFTICRFKPKFTFSSAPVNFTINYNEHFEPQMGFGGSPSDTPRSVDVLTGDTTAFGDEVFEPSSNGIITITDIIVDCVLV